MSEGAAPISLRARLLAIGVLFLAVVGIITFLLTRPRPPRIPSDENHLPIADSVKCLSCHGPGRDAARSKNHPLNNLCFNCHAP